MLLPFSRNIFAQGVAWTGKQFLQGVENSAVYMKDAVLDFMDQKMKINAVCGGFLAAFVTEFLMHKQVLAAVFTSLVRLIHRFSFTKIINSILIVFKFLKKFSSVLFF